ncbi:SUMO-activating enzyme subunit 2-like isoform X2 [Gigantopelta aegis]|uniref:SUMO-activating enzyme subunit 2-like isoform X2 n=1 Tax=Gigantopelta aegis TaxID=1735272 RepID=UPI001B88AEBF|nr:SUMO-activating enzyme subunit 2-like isoform X2 [Gigantopelta aegis]
MAAAIKGVLCESVQENTHNSKILVVGAGGIGCELLKNLVLTGFRDIEVIDLDTIDVSNLNRQFLFRKEHVGKAKAQVAKESAMKFNPDATIVAYHDSVMSPDYGADFFKKFNLVMNALDNRAARNHVNRMCLAADIPLIESGSAGYLGQVTVIKKGVTECYECQPKPTQKTFPGCTIRNTPSEPIHCVVWAKHLFNQLFGEEDPDQEVSPDTEDPELTAEAGDSALKTSAKDDKVGGIERKSTRAWAMETGHDPQKIFNKLFRDDIKYLLSMETLWKKRRSPEPLDWDKLPDTGTAGEVSCMRDQQIWTVKECGSTFSKCLAELKSQFLQQGDGGMLIWDKDDDVAMNFVTCVANIRAHIFGIPLKSRFDIKSMAGNIIPAIATTNAIIAGLLVMEGLKILAGRIDQCRAVYLNRQPNPRKKLLIPCELDKPNPKCYVCSSKPEVTVALNTNKITVKYFEEKILKSELNMVAPDVEIEGTGSIVVSSEEGETDENMDKLLSDFAINNGTRLKCDDFLQNYELVVIIAHVDKFEDEQEFEIIGDISDLKSKSGENGDSGDAKTNDVDQKKQQQNDDDDLVIMEEEDVEAEEESLPTKRKLEETEDTQPPAKRKEMDDDVTPTESAAEEKTTGKKRKVDETGDNDSTLSKKAKMDESDNSNDVIEIDIEPTYLKGVKPQSKIMVDSGEVIEIEPSVSKVNNQQHTEAAMDSGEVIEIEDDPVPVIPVSAAHGSLGNPDDVIEID